MTSDNIPLTLPLFRVGEPQVDFNDLWTQMHLPHARWDLSIRRLPGAGHHHRVTLNGQSI